MSQSHSRGWNARYPPLSVSMSDFWFRSATDTAAYKTTVRRCTEIPIPVEASPLPTIAATLINRRRLMRMNADA